MNKFTTIIASILAGVAILWACSSDPEEVTVDCNASNLAISVVSTTNPGCNLTNGSINVSGSGGGGSYTFSIDGVNFSSAANFTNLAAGNYTISVKDGNQCVASTQASLSSSTNFSIATTIQDAGCNTQNGSINITATGGTPPYSYRINQNSFQSNNVFQNLAIGTYTVTVRDNNGCESNEGNLKVSSGLSLANHIKPIIETNCAIASCHVGGDLPDFRNSATIVSNAGNIKTNTGSKIMPPADSGITLTEDQIRMIACWVDDGAPNN